MALQSTDILLVQRGTTSYQMPASQLRTSDVIKQDLQEVTTEGNRTTNDILLNDGTFDAIQLKAASQELAIGSNPIVSSPGFAVYGGLGVMQLRANDPSYSPIQVYQNSSTTQSFTVSQDGTTKIGGANTASPRIELLPQGTVRIRHDSTHNPEIDFANSANYDCYVNWNGSGTSALKIHNISTGTSVFSVDRNIVKYGDDVSNDSDTNVKLYLSNGDVNIGQWDLTADGPSGSYLFGDGSVYICKNDDASPDNHAIRLYHNDTISFNVTNGGTISNGGFSVDNSGSIDTSGNLQVDGWIKTGLTTNGDGLLQVTTGSHTDTDEVIRVLESDVNTRTFLVQKDGTTKIGGANAFSSANVVFEPQGHGTFNGQLQCQTFRSLGLLKESVHLVAGKVADNNTINLDNGNVHLFTIGETGTNIGINITTNDGFNNDTEVGDTVNVNILITAAGGYITDLNIDGANQMIYWVGGEAPSEGGSDFLDIYSFQIIKTADSTYLIVGSLTKTSS